MIWTLALTVLAAYAALNVAVYVFQERLVFLPVAGLDTDPSALGYRYESLWIPTADGERIHGWWVPADHIPGPRYTVLFFHGNAGNISHRLDTIRVFHRLGLDTLIIDYRGYGRSEGRPSEAATYEDARAAWRHATEALGVAPSRLVVFGRSLGGAVAVALAAERDAAALVVESTFTSVPAIAGEVYPLLPVRYLARIRYDSLARIGSVRCPVLVTHSRDDELVPFRHGERLFEAAPEPKAFMAFSGDHNTGFLSAEYADALGHQLRALLQAGADHGEGAGPAPVPLREPAGRT